MENLQRRLFVATEDASNPLFEEFWQVLAGENLGARNRAEMLGPALGAGERDQRDRVNPAVVERRNGRIIRYTDTHGRTFGFDYDENGRIAEYIEYTDSSMETVRERWVTADNVSWSQRDHRDREVGTWQGRLKFGQQGNEDVIRWEELDDNNRVTVTTEHDLSGGHTRIFPDRSRVRRDHQDRIVEVTDTRGRSITVDYASNGMPRRVVCDGTVYQSNDGNNWIYQRGNERAGQWNGSVLVESDGTIIFRGNDGRAESHSRTGRVRTVNTGLNYRVDDLGRVTHVRRGVDTIYEFRYTGSELQPTYATARQTGVILQRRPGTNEWFEGEVRRAAEPDFRGVIDVDHMGRVRRNRVVQPDLFNNRPNQDD